MLVKVAALAFFVCAITGSHAEVSTDQVGNAFWNYFTQVTTDTKDTVEKIQQYDISKQLKPVSECPKGPRQPAFAKEDLTVKMLVKMIAVTLVFTITGTKTEVTGNKLASAFLNYATQVSSATKNSASVLDLSEIVKQVSDLLEKNIKSVDIENLQKTLSILVKNINNQLTYEKAQQPMLDELERLRSPLSAPVVELNNLFSTISKELLVKFCLYFEDLQAKIDKNALAVSQKLESISLDLDSLTANADNMHLSLALNLINLESVILENLEEVRVHVNIYSEKMTEKLSQQSLILVKNLSPYGDEMKESLRKAFEATCFQIKKVVDQMQTNTFVKASQLKEQVSFFKSSLLGKTYLDVSDAKKTTSICLTDMSQKILLLKDTVTLYGATLKKALIEGLEEMKKMTGLYNVQDSTKKLDNNIQEKLLSFINSTLFMRDS